MASQRQFEGPVLEDLLERVRAEVGPDARIVAANRVRKGGVGGFFARQAFEVLVEPAGPSNRRDSPQLPARPAHRDHATVARSDARRPAPALPRTPSGRTPTTILELADAVSDDERNDVIDLVEERSVSTESRDFAEVLDRFSRSIDATPDELAAASPSRRSSALWRAKRSICADDRRRAERRAGPRRRPADAAAERADRPAPRPTATTTSVVTTGSARVRRPAATRSSRRRPR